MINSVIGLLTASWEAQVVLIATQKRDDKVMISPERNLFIMY